MNGFSTEEDSRDGPPAAPFYGQSCCLIDDGDRCVRPAGNASFSKRIQKSISQKKLKLDIDKSVSCGLRRSCLPPPGPPPRASRPLRVLPSPRRTAVLPGAALRPPRPGGNLLIGQASGASRGVTEPRGCGERGCVGDALCSQVASPHRVRRCSVSLRRGEGRTRGEDAAVPPGAD